MEWISVKDKLPQVEDKVLFYSDGYGIRFGYRQATFANNPKKPRPIKWVVYSSNHYRTDVTHWMPLPEPPKL